MTILLAYSLMYLPPLIGAFLVYRRQKKKQDELHRPIGWVRLYLIPFICWSAFNIVWNLFCLFIAMLVVS